MGLEEEVGLKLAKQIKKCRLKKRLTQEQLAELASISVKHIQRLESKNPCGVRLVTLYRLAQALDMKLGRLLNF